jgi:ankyrin repeat protein
VPVMQLLISKGARTDVRDKLGQTPLYHAAACGQQEAAICLLDHGADVNAAGDQGLSFDACYSSKAPPFCQSPSRLWG